MSPYAALVELARRERALVEEERLDELELLEAVRAELLATLPEQAPPEARDELLALQRVLDDNNAFYAARLAELGVERGTLRRTRTVARTYSHTTRTPIVDADA